MGPKRECRWRRKVAAVKNCFLYRHVRKEATASKRDWKRGIHRNRRKSHEKQERMFSEIGASSLFSDISCYRTVSGILIFSQNKVLHFVSLKYIPLPVSFFLKNVNAIFPNTHAEGILHTFCSIHKEGVAFHSLLINTFIKK